MRRELTLTNGNETRDAEVIERDGNAYLWDKTADPNCDSPAELVDDSDTSVNDAVRDSGFEVVE